MVRSQSEQAIIAVIGSDEEAFVADMVQFAQNYAQQTRQDRELFVDAFRNGQIPGLESATQGS